MYFWEQKISPIAIIQKRKQEQQLNKTPQRISPKELKLKKNHKQNQTNQLTTTKPNQILKPCSFSSTLVSLKAIVISYDSFCGIKGRHEEIGFFLRSLKFQNVEVNDSPPSPLQVHICKQVLCLVRAPSQLLSETIQYLYMRWRGFMLFRRLPFKSFYFFVK